MAVMLVQTPYKPAQAYTYFVTWCPPVVGPMYESKTGKKIRP